MQFSVKVTEYQKNKMLNICDFELLGKDIIQDELKINISRNYYGGTDSSSLLSGANAGICG